MRCSLFVLLACLLYAGQCVADGPRRLKVEEALKAVTGGYRAGLARIKELAEK